MKIAALYARVSTSNQENQKTIDSQVSEIKERISKDGLTLGEGLTFCDNGWSGSLLQRPALDELRDAAKLKVFQVLYVYDLGRLSRDFLNQLILKKELEDEGIKIVSLHDVNNESPESLFAQNMMGLFHDYERKKIAERFRRGKLYKVKEKILFGWNAPYGYKYVKGDKKTIQGLFQIINEEASVIKKIFAWFVNEQLTIRQLIVRLHAQNIFPRKSKNEFWSTSTLSRLLRDKTYIGITAYNKTEAIEAKNPRSTGGYKKVNKTSRKDRPTEEWFFITVPSIIDEQLFNRAQEQLKLNAQFSMRNKVHEYLLSTLVRCSCGNTRAGEGIKNHLYYRCTDRVHRFPLPKQCYAPSVNAIILDAKVWNEIAHLLTEPKRIEQQYKRYCKEIEVKHDNPYFADSEKLKQELKDLKEQEARFVKAYGAKIISLEQLQTQLTDIKFKQQEIIGKLSNTRNDTAPLKKHIVLPDLDELCDKMEAELKRLLFKEKQFVIRQIVEKVVTDGVTASISGYIPLSIPEVKTVNNYEQRSINRYCWAPKCWKINTFQCALKKTGC